MLACNLTQASSLIACEVYVVSGWKRAFTCIYESPCKQHDVSAWAAIADRNALKTTESTHYSKLLERYYVLLRECVIRLLES